MTAETPAVNDTEETPDAAPATTLDGLDLAALILKGLFWTFAALVAVAFLLGAIIPKAFGYTPMTVLTGSMEPTIQPGDVVWIKEGETPGIGSIATYVEPGNTYVTHRVIAVTTGTDQSFTFQGDANNVADDPVSRQNVIGVVTPPASLIGLEGGPPAVPVVGKLMEAKIPLAIGFVALGLTMYVVSHLADPDSRAKRATKRAKKATR